MISQKTHLETQVQDKKYIFQCEATAVLNDTLQALDIFRSYIYGRIKQLEDQEKPIVPETPPSEQESNPNGHQ